MVWFLQFRDRPEWQNMQHNIRYRGGWQAATMCTGQALSVNVYNPPLSSVLLGVPLIRLNGIQRCHVYSPASSTIKTAFDSLSTLYDPRRLISSDDLSISFIFSCCNLCSVCFLFWVSWKKKQTKQRHLHMMVQDTMVLHNDGITINYWYIYTNMKGKIRYNYSFFFNVSAVLFCTIHTSIS